MNDNRAERVRGTSSNAAAPAHADVLSGRLREVPVDLLWRAAPFFVVMWMTSLSTLPALDFWWHIKAGQVILQTRSVPVTDIFSFTAAGQPYFLQNWLGEVFLYLVYRLGGPPLVVFFHSLLLLGATIPIYLLASRRAPAIRSAVAATCLAVIPLVFHSHIRPQAFSFLLFAWFFFILLEFRSRPRLLWLLPVLMALWVNLHGAFVLGIVLIVLFLGLDLVAQVFGEDRLTRSQLTTLLVTLVLTCAATLLNPQLLGIYDYVVKTVWHPVALEHVTEWQPPDIHSFGDLVRFFGPFFMGTVVFIRSKTRATIQDLGTFFAFALLALTARRNGAWFAMIAGPLVAAYLPGGPRLEAASVRGSSRRLNLVIATALVICTLLGLPWMQQRMTARSQERLFLDVGLPVRAVDFIAERQLKGRIFHPQSYGDYLIWRLWPAQRTFIDGRVPIFSPELARDYFQILAAAPDWEQRLLKYEIRYMLLDTAADDQRKLVTTARKSGRWRVLYEDERSVLFVMGQAKPVT